jgi:fimbrial isopeptide formation D2 family protein
MMTSSATATSVTAGETTELAEGYWLLVSDDTAVGTGQSGTSPILVVVGGLPVTASTKSSVPTVEKTVLEDSTDAWQKQADAAVGDELNWKLQATIPAGIKGYATYGITFHDTLPAGLSTPSNVHVYVAAGTSGDEGEKGASAPDGWTELGSSEYAVSSEAQSSGSTLDVTVTDLIKSAATHGMDFSSGLRVAVTYDAPLSAKAGRGFDAPSVNTVTLRYPRSPYSDTYAQTEESTAVAYAWGLSLTKRDSSGDAKLAGAVLRITDDRGRHLAQDGSWTTQDATVTTDANGLVTVSGVDSGTFDVEEVSAPQGYDAFAGSKRITLSVTLDPDQIVSGKDKAAN